jgi:hypothetical protein
MNDDKEKIRLLACWGTAILLCLVSACEKELELDMPETPSKLVVEGWIENGQYAEILLTHTAPYFSAIDSSTLPDFAETHAKVTLFSESDHEILTLKPNQAYFPPYVYRSIDMNGEAGKTYSIEVILDGDTITAVTTIPEPVNLDSAWFEPDPGMDDKGRLWIRLTDDGSTENFYRILYKRKGKDSQFVSTNISTFNDALFNGETVDLGFLRGYSSMITMDTENYFEAGDTISVKFCSIDREQFDFWNVYQSEVLASSNPLATSNNQLKSNVRGGLGIWSGYGSTYYLVYAKKK